jgi:hypothetical protein
MLANVAWILASSGKRVLAVDWDLEAPGLHRYFEPFLRSDPDLLRSEGVIDLVIDFTTEAATPRAEGRPTADDWYVPLANIRRYAVALERDFPGQGRLDFVPSGRQGPSYSARVNSFRWDTFYERFDGGTFIETLKANMKREYEYVLIDSRTGVSDTSGICTVQLPDTVVVCFTLNTQGIEGSAAIAQSLRAQRPSMAILPVPMRIESSEKDKLELRRSYARRRFAGFPANRDVATERYWSDVEVPYVPFYAYEEILAAFADRVGDRYSILGAAQRLAGYVVSGNLPALKAIDESERNWVRGAYEARARDGGAGSLPRYDAFISYGSSDAAAAEEIAGHLRRAGLKPWLDRWELRPGDEWDRSAEEGLKAAGSLVVLVGEDGAAEASRPELTSGRERAGSGELRAFAALLPSLGRGVEVKLPPFLARRAWVDLRDGIDGTKPIAALIDAIRGRTAAPEDPVPEPYVGLRAFQSPDAGIFFGRDAELDRLVEQLADRRFLAIIGGSGVGKTSLVNAGLVPRLLAGREQGSSVVVTLRPGPDPVGALGREVAAVLGNGTSQEWSATLTADPSELARASHSAVTGAKRGARVFWVVDQAEELFTLAERSGKEAFVEALLAAADDAEGPATVLLVLRADFSPSLSQLPTLARRVVANQFLLGPLDRERLMDTIIGPARVAGLQVEEGLPETLIDDVGAAPAALPLLQFVLRAIWQRRVGDVLTLAAYVDSGGVAGNLITRAETVFAGLTVEEQEAARRIFLRLVEPGLNGFDTGRRARIEELPASPENRRDIEAVVATLVAANLLFTSMDPTHGGRVVEVGHEALIRAWPRLRAWMNEPSLPIRVELMDAAGAWRATDGDASFLYRGSLLVAAEALPQRELNQIEREFLRASRTAERSRKLFFGAASILGAANVGALVFALLNIW